MKALYLPVARLMRHPLIWGLMLVAAAGTLSGCGIVDSWNPMPPSGWDNTFYDRALYGKWKLVQANGRPVSTYDTNFLDFYGNGRGAYYYYSNGAPYSERIAYWCEDSYNSTSRYKINIQYESGQASTMNYWFTDGGDVLWMQWMTSGGTVTYMYRLVSGIVW